MLEKETNSNRDVKINDLSITEKIYLGALFSICISNNKGFSEPIKNIAIPYSPSSFYDDEIISDLISLEYIIPLIDYEDTKSLLWSLNINIEDTSTYIQKVNTFLDEVTLTEDDYLEILFMWKKVALYEVIEYYQHLVFKYIGGGFNSRIETFDILTSLLNNFSVSQTYNIIFSSIKNTLEYNKKNNTTKSHLFYQTLINIEKYGQNIVKNNWVIDGFNRLNNLPQSAISHYLYHKILKIDGFNTIPNIYNLVNTRENNISKTEIQLINNLFTKFPKIKPDNYYKHKVYGNVKIIYIGIDKEAKVSSITILFTNGNFNYYHETLDIFNSNVN
ncbi:hypothetical protein [Tenacibaculum singaporense]|uniref:Uncharacterized protein n=1 Tax=Tenacibaculum singaporense TaxID=2358479 RepID=A0A3Q8RSP2_9FLAO|nr:hypothetical protein [Tenacibaculum singaporense]AZJ36797.1 hypothetical protein D6T69_15125 [Tenacibaculum singaporense]